MKKIKLVGKILLWTVVVVVAVVLALPLWIGPVAKGVANAVAPRITGTDFHLGEFGLNPYVGTLHVGDMQLANPTNFTEKNALDLTAFDVDVDVASIFSGKKYIVESIDIDGVVVYSDPTASNFRQIADNATGGNKSSGTQAGEPPAQQQEPGQPKDENQKGVQIDRITLKNVTVKYGASPIKIPMAIEITGIGADSENGATLEEVCTVIFNKVMSAAGSLGAAIGDLGKGVGDIGKGVIDATKAVDIDSAAESLKNAGDDLRNLFRRSK